MRADQLARLNDLAEKLADTFLTEADPAEWPGGSVGPADLTQQERGDRYWCKKNAMATGGVLRFTLDMLERQQPGGAKAAEQDDADLDRQIREAERRANAAVSRALDKAKKQVFDERTHGKP